MSANAATSDFGDYAPAAHTDEDDLGVGSPHVTTSSSSSSSSRTSFSIENSPTTGRISGDVGIACPVRDVSSLCSQVEIVAVEQGMVCLNEHLAAL